MDLYTYVVLSIVYIMVIHFAVSIRKHFDLFLVVFAFLLGGFAGHYFQSYEFGFGVAFFISLIFW